MAEITETHPIRLSNRTLTQVPTVFERPSYDRSQLSPGMVHIGLGNFHRAHQAWYLHRLMQQGDALDWGVLGASVRQNDLSIREKLRNQDCLTTLIELDPAAQKVEITGSMIDYLPIEQGHGPLINAIADPRVRIVSLTVTEGGYFIDPSTGAFDAEHPDILKDVENPDQPASAFGAIVAALRVRRSQGSGPVTLMSCDNLQGNGTILRNTVVSLAQMVDASLARWIQDNCSFPNSMVDCIVPATGSREVEIARRFGIDDPVPVTHENFRQWVLEDDFCAGRPPWEDVGVQFTRDVHMFESMKLRMLNAGHQLLANSGEVIGLATIDQCMAHPLIAGFFRKVETDEIAPFVDAVPGMQPEAYASLIEKRFLNPEVRDTVRRVAFDGSSRHPAFLVPSLRDALASDSSIDGLCLAEALWARMCQGIREDGSDIAPNDPHWAELVPVAKAAKDDPMNWLAQRQYYGSVAGNTRFQSIFCYWMNVIDAEGVLSALEKYTSRKTAR